MKPLYLASGAAGLAVLGLIFLVLRHGYDKPGEPANVQANESILVTPPNPSKLTAGNTASAAARGKSGIDNEDLPEASAQEAKDYMIAHHMATAEELNAYNQAEMDAVDNESDGNQ
jgi:hypothetical protein